jgi:hypothetical protein
LLQVPEGEHQQLQQTVPPALPEDGVLQSKQTLAGKTKNSYGLTNQGGGHFTCASRGNHAKLNFLDIKQLLDRCMTQNKRGTLTSGEIKLLVQEIHDHRQEDKLQQHTVEMEMSAIQQKIQRYNVEQWGGDTSSQGGWHNEDSCVSNGRVHKRGSQENKNIGYRKID